MKVVLDQLTGLYNRTYLSQIDFGLLEENEIKYVMFLDLDHFKHINDTFGHRVGDFILKETSKRLKALIETKGTICRYGGDEIIIIINNNIGNEITNLAKRIIEVLTKPFERNGSNYEIGVSIGIAKRDINSKNIKVLIKNSDDAMYKAKKNGGNKYVLWSEAKNEKF